MSLTVNDMVLEGTMEKTDCILCGACAGTCPEKAISNTWMEKTGIRS